MNLSETAFVRPRPDGFDLRWFTPKLEVDLCGHATLASAHALWTTGAAPSGEPIGFHSRGGVLVASQSGDFIELDFPATPAIECEPPPGLLAALGLEGLFVARTRFDIFLLAADASVVRALRPDFRQLAKVPARGVIVTAPSDDPRYDFVSRFFAPAAGVDEDPVTGSAHCCLGPFWSERLGKPSVVGYQASTRGGVVHARPNGDRVSLGGRAATVLEGRLLV
jgi:PhzF family phenazine biosynthesis protein